MGAITGWFGFIYWVDTVLKLEKLFIVANLLYQLSIVLWKLAKEACPWSSIIKDT